MAGTRHHTVSHDTPAQAEPCPATHDHPQRSPEQQHCGRSHYRAPSCTAHQVFTLLQEPTSLNTCTLHAQMQHLANWQGSCWCILAQPPSIPCDPHTAGTRWLRSAGGLQPARETQRGAGKKGGGRATSRALAHGAYNASCTWLPRCAQPNQPATARDQGATRHQLSPHAAVLAAAGRHCNLLAQACQGVSQRELQGPGPSMHSHVAGPTRRPRNMCCIPLGQ